MFRLNLVRHGHTIWHASGGVAGRSDIDLSAEGQSAVTALAKSWQAFEKIELWYCSPLLRTRHTTQLLYDAMVYPDGLPQVQIDERLVELNFGDWEGMSWQSVNEQYRDEMKHWGEDWVNRSPPNGETFSEQARRCNDWLADVVELSESENKHSERVGLSAMVVLHGGSIRALICECLGWPLTRAMDFTIDPASVTTLDMDPRSGLWTLKRLNSLSFDD